MYWWQWIAILEQFYSLQLMKSSGYNDLIVPEKVVEELARKYYDLKGKALAIRGEVDFNYHFVDEAGAEHTIKISRPGIEESELEFQTHILDHLSGRDISLDLPAVELTCDGSERTLFEDKQGNLRWFRMHRWVPGITVADLVHRSPILLRSWGAASAQLLTGLNGFDHPYAHREYRWDPSRMAYSTEMITLIDDRDRSKMVEHFFKHFEAHASPLLPALRKGVNYNDAHEHNLLVSNVREPMITGVIDFGDALYSHTINELAIACAYASQGMNDPLKAATEVIRGFHKFLPLNENEVQALFPLMVSRLVISALTAVRNLLSEPDNAYLQISAKPTWRLLETLYTIPPTLVHYSFRQASGFEPCTQAGAYQSWGNKHKKNIHPVVDTNKKRVVQIDLGVASKDLGNNTNFDTSQSFQATISRMLQENSAEIGIGGYGEVRPFYSTDEFKEMGNMGWQYRSNHLGTDIWTNAGTPVFAPLDARVHSFQDNKSKGNYGPTIILEHQVSKELTFYTLYGHLSRASLNKWKPGDVINGGDHIADVGSPDENGGWSPHIHFQVILDIMNWNGDFPGVSFPEESATWMSICPDPHQVSGIKSHDTRIKNKTPQEIEKSRAEHLGQGLSISYARPLNMVRGFMQYLYDNNARRYLDTVNNVPHVGHSHPRVVQSAHRQQSLLNTNTRYLHENIVSYAESLISTLPPPLSVVHFVNSGSEANELALRMVEAFTGSRYMVAVEVGYHGNTGRCIDVSSYKFDGKGGKGAPPETSVVPIPDTYNGIYRGNPEKSGIEYANHVKRSIEQIDAGRAQVGRFHL